jgi:hypothetical protein
MMSSYIRLIRKLGSLMGDLLASATGCFALNRGFRVAAWGQERPAARSSMRTEGKSTKPFEGIGAALFLLAFVASEAGATLVALRR